MTILTTRWRSRQFPLPAFELQPLEFDTGADELLLEEVVVSLWQNSSAIRPVQPMPTAGELHARIDRHLHGDRAPAPTTDAAGELRSALAELRRSLG